MRNKPGAGQAPDFPEDLDDLRHMARDQLALLWPMVGRRGEPPPTQRSLLAAEIAWRVQARAKGGLDAQTSRLLAKAVREIEREQATREEGDGVDAASNTPRRQRTTPAPKRQAFTTRMRASDIPASARLIRVWPAGSATRHEVLVLEGGRAFEYRGQRYASLTKVAREITGTHWSGPRFFGLSTRASPAKQETRR